MPATTPQPITMQCLQVWGGNQAASQTLRLTGLDGYLVSRPYEDADAGGDVYYASSCASGRISRIILADVAGHGEAVARFAQDLRKLMQRFVNYTSHRKFIAALNRAYGAMTDDGRFATAVTVSYYAPTNDLHVINAGHPPPLFFHAASRRWSLLNGHDSEHAGDGQPKDAPGGSRRSNDLPLGIDDAAGYHTIRRTLGPGDLVLLYTDAFIEAQLPDGRQLGVAGLLDTVNGLTGAQASLDPEAVLPELIAHLAADRADTATLAGDDTTALLLCATGEKRRWGQVLTSPYHLVRGMAMGALPTLTH